MNYEARYNSDFGNDDPTIDWRSANPISRGSKLRIFMTRSMSKFWKKKFIACYKLFREHSNVERPAGKSLYQECASLSHADQLTSVAGVIEDAMAGFGRIRGCQRAAAQQLSAADYVLEGLLAELATAMPTTAVEPVSQTVPVAVSEPLFTESEPAVADEDGALAA